MDLDTLLLPLSADEPCGVPLLHEPEYDDIGSARLEDDPNLPRGVWTIDLKKANWREVVRLCETALSRRGKDLQVAAWLGEAWIALDGIAGGLRAVSLFDGLFERYWQDLHPRPRGNDYDFRTAPLNWADEYWSRAVLMRIALVSGTGPEARSFTLLQWNEAIALENSAAKNKDARKQAESTGAPTYARILDNLATMALASVVERLEGVQAWKAALGSFNDEIAPRLPPPGARMSKLEKRLQEAEDVLKRCRELHPAYVAPPLAAPALEAVAVLSDPPAPAQEHGIALAGRADAYQKLEEIAAYLARIEPHSPVPSLIRRAVEWGAMPFDTLLLELTKNNGELQKMLIREAG